MKKILVVLLILAVAGGVFAQQGSWSLSGQAQIGTRVDFDPTPGHVDNYGETKGANNPNNDQALVNGSMYFRPYDYWSAIRGEVSLGYTRGPMGVGLSFDTSGFINGTATATGENYRFQVVSGLNNLIYPNSENFRASGSTFVGGGGSGADSSHVLSRLWGEYRMLNGLVALEIAYRSRDTEFWVSDKTAAIDDDNFIRGYSMIAQLFKDSHTFTKVDRGNFLLTNLNFENFQAGIMVPQLFPTSYTAGQAAHQGVTSRIGRNPNTGELIYDEETGDLVRNKSGRVELVEDVIKQSILGIKFSQSPIEVAGQFKLADYGVYIGGKFFMGPVTFGLSFSGILDNDVDQIFKFGGRVDYNAGLFGAGIRGFYGRLPRTTSAGADYYDSVLGIEPSFFYNAIPSHLRFQLDAGFYFDNTNMTLDNEDKEIIWAVQPQLFWNFAGTGAGDYWGFGTGMILRYRLMSDPFKATGIGGENGNRRTNALDVAFKFSI